MEKLRPIAFYLPQFHPIPENDQWWGRGFTEWTNVTKAKPLFRGHYQPHLPSDLGFYDLRLPESRQAQADLARESGIFGFCYYHYWFAGRRLLERPFDEVLSSGQPNFPFCLCWANESWSRRWDGEENEILIAQSYSQRDVTAHFTTLLLAFKDERYIKINNKPLFLIYRASRLPNASQTFADWRTQARNAGLDGLYLCNVECFSEEHGLAPQLGLDAAVEFAPDWGRLPKPQGNSTLHRWASKIGIGNPAALGHNIFDYDRLMKNMLEKPDVPYIRYRCVTPSWDNTARRQEGATILEGSTPDKYQFWLEAVINRFVPPSPTENFVFINAWNEWAEGNHLEPCARWGKSYLCATRAAFGFYRNQ